MKTRSISKPDTKAATINKPLWPAIAILILILLGIALLFNSVNAAETVVTNSEKVTVQKSTTVSPIVREHLCGGCGDDEGLNADCRIGGDICLEKREVRQFLNVAEYKALDEAVPQASESEFVLLVYMVDYLFHDGEHLSDRNIAALIDQDLCPQITIDCVSQTVNRVLSIDATTIKPSTR